MEDKHQERRISDATALPDDKHLIYDDPPASASLKSQLATWHANRGDRSFLSMVIPRWRVADTENSGETKNPIKLFRMVDGRSWLLFIASLPGGFMRSPCKEYPCHWFGTSGTPDEPYLLISLSPLMSHDHNGQQ